MPGKIKKQVSENIILLLYKLETAALCLVEARRMQDSILEGELIETIISLSKQIKSKQAKRKTQSEE